VIIHRLCHRLPRLNFRAIDAALTQLYFYRALCGGIFVKMNGRWHGAVVLMTLGDGSRILRQCGRSGSSFHETFNGIQQLEDHS
jgi:hypothetical protein